MIVFPNTKINIGLNIVSDRSDNYHNLETLFILLASLRRTGSITWWCPEYIHVLWIACGLGDVKKEPCRQSFCILLK